MLGFVSKQNRVPHVCSIIPPAEVTLDVDAKCWWMPKYPSVELFLL